MPLNRPPQIGNNPLHRQGLMEGRRPDGTARYVPQALAPPRVLGLRADIYRTTVRDFLGPVGDCSNGGISSRCTAVTIVGQDITDAGAAISTPDEHAPPVKIVHRLLGGCEIIHLEPVRPPTAPHVGPMMGGCYVATPDSRLTTAIALGSIAEPPLSFFYGAIALHDRYETVEQYRSHD